jgi:hypothetical protein
MQSSNTKNTRSNISIGLGTLAGILDRDRLFDPLRLAEEIAARCRAGLCGGELRRRLNGKRRHRSARRNSLAKGVRRRKLVWRSPS